MFGIADLRNSLADLNHMNTYNLLCNVAAAGDHIRAMSMPTRHPQRRCVENDSTVAIVSHPHIQLLELSTELIGRPAENLMRRDSLDDSGRGHGRPGRVIPQNG